MNEMTAPAVLPRSAGKSTVNDIPVSAVKRALAEAKQKAQLKALIAREQARREALAKRREELLANPLRPNILAFMIRRALGAYL